MSMIFEAYGSGASKVKGGRLRALAVTSTARLPALPDVPTIAEQGIPGFNYYLWFGLLVPAGTPADAVNRLSEALRSALGSKELAERLRADVAEPLPMTHFVTELARPKQ
nr:tripartite tricarboxylate transporter substrate-binding protein [Rhodoferax sediminis]